MQHQIKSSSILPQMPWSAKSQWLLTGRAFCVLILSLCCLGIGDALIVLANLGSTPWTVLSQGLAKQGDFSIGFASFIVSVVVMLFWLPLRLKIGLGTLLNIVVIAFTLGISVEVITPPSTMFSRFFYTILGTVLFGVGSAFYLTCHLGAGPRDGLMVGLCQRFGLKVGVVRTLLETSVCLLGFLLGGTVGVGTLMFAMSIGWVIQLTLKYLFCEKFLKKAERS